MSNIAIAGNASGTGTFTIASPNSNTSRTLNLPDATGTVLLDNNVTSLNGGQLAGFRNKIINGKMEIAQRGTSFSVAYDYTLDRWAFAEGGGSCNITQSTDVPNTEFQYSIRATVVAANASVDSVESAQIAQTIEGFNVRDLIGRTFTLSFWVRSPKTGTHCVAFRNNNSDRSYIATYTVNAIDTWEYKTVSVIGGLITDGLWNWTNGAGLKVSFILAAGSSFHTTANAWQSGSYLSTSAQVNCNDTVGNIFAITGVQLEVGAVATPFEHRPYGSELALCQRYYEKGYSFCSVTPVGISPVFTQQYVVEKRGTPSISVTVSTAVTASAAGTTYYSTGGFDYSPDTKKFVLYNSATAAAVGASWAASAEL